MRLVDEQHGQVGQRVDLHLADHVLRELAERVLVDRDPRLVVDVDAHFVFPVFALDVRLPEDWLALAS